MTSWLTVKDVCAELRIGRTTWYRWVNDDEKPTPEPIEGIGRMVRYRRDDFLAFKDSIGGPIGGQSKAA